MAALSLEAAWLFILLIAAQDDTGWWPWTRVKVQRLTIGRGWSYESATEYAGELVKADIALWVEGGLLLLKGEKLNGHHRNDVKREVYDRIPGRSRESPATDTPRIRCVDARAEKSRVEESREEAVVVVVSAGESKKIEPERESLRQCVLTYEAEVGMISKAIADKIQAELEDGTPAEWIVKALHRAATHNVRKWAYARGILQNWKAQGHMDNGPLRTAKEVPRGKNIQHHKGPPADAPDDYYGDQLFTPKQGG